MLSLKRLAVLLVDEVEAMLLLARLLDEAQERSNQVDNERSLGKRRAHNLKEVSP